MENMNETEVNESFEDLLEESLDKIQEFSVGDEVEGEISNINDKYIFISLGGKNDACAELREYQDRKGKLIYKVGDKVKGYVVRSDDSETVIAKSINSVNKYLLKDAFEEKIPIRGKVTSIIKGGFRIDVSGFRAFCPISQMDVKVVTEPNDYINKEYDFEIIELDNSGKNIVLSRKRLLSRELLEQKKEMLSKINIGDVLKGTVSRLTNFGAFVNIGPLEGLIHISEFDWTRVESPSDVLKINDEVEAKVIKIKGDKVSLSLKMLKPDPYQVAFDELNIGDIVTCKILRNLPFGSFVEIKPGVEGLIPVSEIVRGRRINKPDEILSIGDMVEAKIQRINKDNQKISLSIKALLPDPWDKVDNDYSEGDVVTGTIENIMDFGVFVKLNDGVTGLLPKSKMALVNMVLNNDSMGTEISLRISRIDTINKKISLEPTDIPENAGGNDRHERRDDWKKYKKAKDDKSNNIDQDNPFSML